MKGVGYGVAPFATFVPTIFVRGCHTRSGASTCAPHATSSPSARDADGKSTAAAVVATGGAPAERRRRCGRTRHVQGEDAAQRGVQDAQDGNAHETSALTSCEDSNKGTAST